MAKTGAGAGSGILRNVMLNLQVQGGAAASGQISKFDKQLGVLKGSVDVLSKSFRSFSGIISNVGQIVGAGLGIGVAIKYANDYAKSIVSLSAQFQKWGVGIGGLETRLYSLSKAIHMTRLETMELASAYEKAVPYASLKAFEDIMRNIYNVTGANKEQISGMQGVLTKIIEQYPSIQASVAKIRDEHGNINKEAEKELNNIVSISAMRKSLGLEELKRLQEYINQNRQRRKEDEKILDKHKETLDAMQDLKKAFEDVTKVIGDKLLPYIKSISKFLTENLETIVKTVESTVKWGIAVWGVVNAFKVLHSLGVLKLLFSAGTWKTLASGVAAVAGSAAAIPLAFTAAVSAIIAAPAVLEIRKINKETVKMLNDIQQKQDEMVKRDAENVKKAKETSEDEQRIAEARLRLSTARAASNRLDTARAKQGVTSHRPWLDTPEQKKAKQEVHDAFAELQKIQNETEERKEDAQKAKERSETLEKFKGEGSEYGRRMFWMGKSKEFAQEVNILKVKAEQEKSEERRAEILEKMSGAMAAFQLAPREQSQFIEAQTSAYQSQYSAIQKQAEIMGLTGQILKDDVDLTKLQVSKNTQLVNLKNQLQTAEDNLLDLTQLRDKEAEKLRKEGKTEIEIVSLLDMMYGKRLAEAQEQIYNNQQKINSRHAEWLNFLQLSLRAVENIVRAQSALASSSVSLLNAEIERMQVMGQENEPQMWQMIGQSVDEINKDIQKQNEFIRKTRDILGMAGDELEKILVQEGKSEQEAKDLVKSGTYQLELRNKVKQAETVISNRLTEQRKIMADASNLYNMRKQVASLEVQYQTQLVSLMDQFAVGVGASAKMRLEAVGLLQEQLSLVDHQIALEKKVIKAAKDRGQVNMTAEIKLRELQNERMGLLQKEAEMAKALRDGWVSAVNAMTVGSGRITKIAMTADKNLGLAVQNLGMVRTFYSGAVGRAGEGEVGQRKAEQFRYGPGGIATIANPLMGQPYNVDTGIPMQNIEQMIRGGMLGDYIANYIGEAVGRAGMGGTALGAGNPNALGAWREYGRGGGRYGGAGGIPGMGGPGRGMPTIGGVGGGGPIGAIATATRDSSSTLDDIKGVLEEIRKCVCAGASAVANVVSPTTSPSAGRKGIVVTSKETKQDKEQDKAYEEMSKGFQEDIDRARGGVSRKTDVATIPGSPKTTSTSMAEFSEISSTLELAKKLLPSLEKNIEDTTKSVQENSKKHATYTEHLTRFMGYNEKAKTKAEQAQARVEAAQKEVQDVKEGRGRPIGIAGVFPEMQKLAKAEQESQNAKRDYDDTKSKTERYRRLAEQSYDKMSSDLQKLNQLKEQRAGIIKQKQTLEKQTDEYIKGLVGVVKNVTISGAKMATGAVSNIYSGVKGFINRNRQPLHPESPVTPKSPVKTPPTITYGGKTMTLDEYRATQRQGDYANVGEGAVNQEEFQKRYNPNKKANYANVGGGETSKEQFSAKYGEKQGPFVQIGDIVIKGSDKREFDKQWEKLRKQVSSKLE